MASPVIEVRGLEKRYGPRTVLRGIDLVLPQQTAFGLVGPNGAGKTTFIKVLLGIVRPNGGKLRLLGYPPQSARSRRKVGYLPERLALPDDWTPLDHLRAIARLKGVLGDPPESLLEQVALDRTAWRRRIRGFSKGMRQRVGLATALVGSPELLVLDEPTDGIDPLGRVHIRGVLSERVRRGATVFLNSHLLSETEKLCERVAILGKGQILTEGTLEDLKPKGVPVARFSPHPQTEAIARRHGLVETGHGFALADNSSPEAMSTAIAGALADGLVLLELSSPTSDLEAVLRNVLEGAAP